MRVLNKPPLLPFDVVVLLLQELLNHIHEVRVNYIFVLEYLALDETSRHVAGIRSLHAIIDDHLELLGWISVQFFAEMPAVEHLGIEATEAVFWDFMAVLAIDQVGGVEVEDPRLGVSYVSRTKGKGGWHLPFFNLFAEDSAETEAPLGVFAQCYEESTPTGQQQRGTFFKSAVWIERYGFVPGNEVHNQRWKGEPRREKDFTLKACREERTRVIPEDAAERRELLVRQNNLNHKFVVAVVFGEAVDVDHRWMGVPLCLLRILLNSGGIIVRGEILLEGKILSFAW